MGDVTISTKVQKSGMLYKKPFGQGGASLMKKFETRDKWQRRFFVLKDGFLLYYAREDMKMFEEHGQFNIHPKGVIPLGGCDVEAVQEGPTPNSCFGFRITHADFGKGSLILAADSQAEADEWIESVRDSGKVTWANAQLGEAMVCELRSKGTQLESEKHELVKKWEAEALALSMEQNKREEYEVKSAVLEEEKKAVEEKKAILEEEKKAVEAKASELEQQKAQLSTELETTKDEVQRETRRNRALSTSVVQLEEEARALEGERQEVESEKEKISMRAVKLESNLRQTQAERDETEKKLQVEAQARVKLEKRLLTAEQSLKRLDRALRESGVRLEMDYEVDFNKLKEFFVERAEEIRWEKESARIIKQALAAKKEYDGAGPGTGSGAAAEKQPEEQPASGSA